MKKAAVTSQSPGESAIAGKGVQGTVVNDAIEAYQAHRRHPAPVQIQAQGLAIAG